MRKLNKISLHNLSQTELSKKEERMLTGGELSCLCVIGCGCKYAGDKEGDDDDFWGGSSKEESGDANQRPDMGYGLTN